MTYTVEAYRSLSLCRAYAVMELRHRPMHWGPYKRLKYAKRKATALRKDRCVCMKRDDTEYRDYGPSFVKVRVVERGEDFPK